MYFKKNIVLKVIFLFSIFGAFINASELEIAARIIDKTVASLFPNKKSVKTWANSEYHIKLISKSKKMSLAGFTEKASFYLVGSSIDTYIPKNTIIFATDIDLFYNDERVIGAFYWQKGRPNLIFLKERLDKYKLSLSEEFSSYIEETL